MTSALLMASTTYAQISGGGGIGPSQFWKLVGTVLSPVNNTWSVLLGSFSMGSFTNTTTTAPQAKGDLIVASSPSAWTNLATGSNGKVLTSSTTAPNGVSWETPASGGIQSLNGSTSSTQIFAAGNGIGISTLNGVHTFTNTSSSQWTTSSTSIFYNGGNVGIGITNPVYALDVSGQAHISATTTVDGVILAGNNYTPYPEYTFGPDPNTGLDSTAPDVMNLVNAGINTMTLTSSNRVGVGTTTPATALVVNGDITQTTLSTGLVKSTSGKLINATSGIDYAPATSGTSILKGNGSGGFSAATNGTDYLASSTINVGTGLSKTSDSASTTFTNTGVTSTVAGTNITQSVNGGTVTINTTTTPSFTSITFPDSTKQSTAYRDLAFNVYNTSSTTAVGASSTVQKIFYKAMTLTQVDCSTDGSSITIQADIRSSSTPQTYGTSAFSGLVCSSTGVSTTTSANISAGQVLNFWESSVPNATTTLRVNFRVKEQ